MPLYYNNRNGCNCIKTKKIKQKINDKKDSLLGSSDPVETPIIETSISYTISNINISGSNLTIGYKGGSPTPLNGKFLGGWTNCDTKTWLPSWGCNSICTGRFGNIINNIPPLSDGYENIIYTIGGASEPNNPPPGYIYDIDILQSTNKMDLINLANQYTTNKGYQSNGICFDIEGAVTVNMVIEWLNKWGTTMDERLSNLEKYGIKYLIGVPAGTQVISDNGKYYIPSNFTHLAPMAYQSNDNSYPGLDYFAKGNGNTQWNDGDLKKAIENGFESDKIIFTFQSFNAFNYSGRDNMFKQMVIGLGNNEITTAHNYVLNGPFGGILGWAAQLDQKPCSSGGNADKDNFNLISQYIKKYY